MEGGEGNKEERVRGEGVREKEMREEHLLSSHR